MTKTINTEQMNKLVDDIYGFCDDSLFESVDIEDDFSVWANTGGREDFNLSYLRDMAMENDYSSQDENAKIEDNEGMYKCLIIDALGHWFDEHDIIKVD